MPPEPTDWRQGHLLTLKSAQQLELFSQDSTTKRAIVISHDCDLQNSEEKNVEVIVGKIERQPHARYENARHPRILHLRLEPDIDGVITLEVKHSQKMLISRDMFLQKAERDQMAKISADSKRTLKQWLAARYGRPAFPSSFENRLRKVYQDKIVEQSILQILENHSEYLVGVFFDLGEARHEELMDQFPYLLSIYVVYRATEGAEEARCSAEKTALSLEKLFYGAYGMPPVSAWIELEQCIAIADTHFTISDLRKVDQWRAEYISLAGSPIESFLPTGERPI